MTGTTEITSGGTAIAYASVTSAGNTTTTGTTEITSGGTAIAYASVTSAGNTTTTEITTVGTEIADPATTYAGITTTTLDQIDQFYTAIDYGPPPTLSPAAIAQYEAEGPAQVISAIENSSYTLNVVDQIIREFQAAFNRVPDQAGEAHWVHQLGAGAISLKSALDRLCLVYGVRRPSRWRDRHHTGQHHARHGDVRKRPPACPRCRGSRFLGQLGPECRAAFADVRAVE